MSLFVSATSAEPANLEERIRSRGFGRSPGCSMLFASADSGSGHGAGLVQATESVRPCLGTRHYRDDAGHEFQGHVYQDNKLIANRFATKRLENEKRQISFPHFLALAWTAANEKAKEIGWIR